MSVTFRLAGSAVAPVTVRLRAGVVWHDGDKDPGELLIVSPAEAHYLVTTGKAERVATRTVPPVPAPLLDTTRQHRDPVPLRRKRA